MIDSEDKLMELVGAIIILVAIGLFILAYFQ